MSADKAKDAGAGTNRHGGVRVGAGRPRKWFFDDIVAVGQACEMRWREASNQAVVARISALPHSDKIKNLQEIANKRPVPQRKSWLSSDLYEDHTGDVEAFLHARANTPFNYETGEYEGSAPRTVSVSTKPTRGTRKRIIAEVAEQFGLSLSVVDNLWQAYRRFEQEIRQDSAQS